MTPLKSKTMDSDNVDHTDVLNFDNYILKVFNLYLNKKITIGRFLFSFESEWKAKSFFFALSLVFDNAADVNKGKDAKGMGLETIYFFILWKTRAVGKGYNTSLVYG